MKKILSPVSFLEIAIVVLFTNAPDKKRQQFKWTA